MDTARGAVQHLCFVARGGELVLAAARDQGVELIATDGTAMRTLDAERTVSSLVALRADDSGDDRILAGGTDGVVRAYDVNDGAEVFASRVGQGTVRDLATFGDRTDPTVVAALESSVLLWNPADGRTETLAAPDGVDPHRLFKVCAYQAAGRQMVTGAYTDGLLVTWDLETGTTTIVSGHDGPIWSLVVVTDADTGDPRLVSGGSDRRTQVWHPEDGALRPGTVFVGDGTVRRLGHVVDHRSVMLVTASASGSVSLWRADGSPDRPETEIARHSGEVWALACATTPDGVLIASGDMNGDLSIRQLSTALLSAESIRAVHGGESTLWTVTRGHTARGGFVAVAGVERKVTVVDPTGSHAPLTLREHTSTVRALACGRHDGVTHLISGGADHRVLDWDPETGNLRAELPMGHESEVWTLATYRTDAGLFLVSGSAGGSVRTVELVAEPVLGRPPVVLAEDLGEVNAVVPVPDDDGGTIVVVGSSRGLRSVPTEPGPAARTLSLAPVSAVCAVQERGRQLVVSARQDGVVELVDPIAGSVVTTFARSFDAGMVRSLAAVEVGGTTFVLGGCDDGHVVVWHIDGTLVGRPVQGSRSGIRAMVAGDVAFPGQKGAARRPGSALVTAGNDGVVRLWPVTADIPLRAGGSVGRGVRPASILLQDQPTDHDDLSRAPLVETLFEALTSPDTTPPVVVGVHAPWGQGKSSLLRQLRGRVDPWTTRLAANTNSAPGQEPTHTLVAVPPRRSRWFAWAARTPRVRTRLTRGWAWAQIARAGEANAPLQYEMKPRTHGGFSAITVWFNPWMYERTDQIWAGLTREILIAVTERLSKEERERLWFDLNLRRTDPSSMRRRILSTYLPRTLVWLIVDALLLFLTIVAVVAMSVAAVNDPRVTSLIGPTVLVILAVLGTVAQLTSGSFKHIHGWVAPDELNSHGGPEHSWKGSSDPLTSTDRGYLYLLQHDVGEVVGLATEHSPLFIFIDDLDRCGPDIVADTIEAINLFLNKAFGQCIFVVALDPATVAAHLETAFHGIDERAKEDPTSFGHLRHTGWRFMEKIIDLPIRLPRVPDVALSQYLDQLLGAAATVPGQAGPGQARPGQAGSRPGRTEPAATTVPAEDPTPPEPASTAPARTVAQVKTVLVPDGSDDDAVATVDRLESLQEVREALRTAVLSLPNRNPRQTKAFVNLWRFYMVLDHRTGLFNPSRLAMERHSIEMARLVELMVRWPYLLDLLGEQATEGDIASPSNLDLLLDACAAGDEAWADTARRSRLDPADRSTVALRDLLCRALPHREIFTPLAHRYL